MENNNTSLSTEEEALLEQTLNEIHNSSEVSQKDNKLPENSKTLEVQTSTSRFSSASWFNEVRNIKVSIAGLGGIGSWTALLIARLSPNNMLVYDNDSIESANLSGQLYDKSSVGELKANCTYINILKYSDCYNIGIYNCRFDKHIPVINPILICGFDNMKSRREAFQAWLNQLSTINAKEDSLFIDGRLSAETFQIYCIRGNDEYGKNKYMNECLFDDKDADSEICSYKQTSFCASMIASYITNLVVNFCDIKADNYRPLPFYVEYDARTMLLKCES